MTRDSVTVTVDAVVYFRIQNATVSVTNVSDAQGSTKLLAQTTLRNMIGTKNLSDILMDREGLSSQMQVCLSLHSRYLQQSLSSPTFLYSNLYFLFHMSAQQLFLDDATDPWGVRVERVEM